MVKENTELINIVKRLLPCDCPRCLRSNIVIYDAKNNKINYSLLCKYNNREKIYKKIERVPLKYMQCESCKSIFVLDWTRDIIPYPVDKYTYREFEIL